MDTGKKNVATLNDVAREAGVSKFTVSRVLNGRLASARVSETTRQRILATVDTLRYRPNAVARSLRRRRTGIVGAYFGFSSAPMTTPFTASTMQGFQNGCNANRYDLLVHGTFRGGSVDDIYGELTDGKIDGLLIFALADNPLLALLAASHLPVVAVGSVLPGIASVVVDDGEAGRLQAGHLAQAGHRHVLFIGSDRAQTSSERRQAAFFAEAARLGLQVRGEMAHTASGFDLPDAVVAQIARRDAGRVTAVACWCDGVAQSVVNHCLAHGVAVPQALAVVGCDGFWSNVTPARRLSTVGCFWEKVGERAVAVLHDLIGGAAVADETVMPVEWIAGDTT